MKYLYILFSFILFNIPSIPANASGTEHIAPAVSQHLPQNSDQCPDDILKTLPGICGCGVTENDSDNNGIMDCTEQDTGFTDIRRFLVTSSGSYSLGNTSATFNTTRDQGSKIVFFNNKHGDNKSADVYWWDGEYLIDSTGSRNNPTNGLLYGKDPLQPNEEAIRPFLNFISAGDDRLRTQAGRKGPKGWEFAGVAGGYPDWVLFRRGQTHDTFDRLLTGGRSEEEPMVISAYGPLTDGRAIIDPGPGSKNPFKGHNWGLKQSWLHQVLFSLEIHGSYGYLNTHLASSFNGQGPVTAHIEDCYWPTLHHGVISYPPRKTTIKRSIISNSWSENKHNQGYFTNSFSNRVTFDEVIFYKNGYKTNPLTDPDPKRDIYSRNVYQGGGAQMGHNYINVLFADGASGGPQMRLGGFIENSLIIEGYWFSSTRSNNAKNSWLEKNDQQGISAYVRNNVQLIYGYPTPNDPDTENSSDTRAQPFWGYSMGGASFGSIVENNIISGAMLNDDLNGGFGRTGMKLDFKPTKYSNGQYYSQQNNQIRGNIIYKVQSGFKIEGDAQDVNQVKINKNIIVATNPLSGAVKNLLSTNQVELKDNRFYTEQKLTDKPWIADNVILDFAEAKRKEKWKDPDRTLKRYVTEVLNMSLLDWQDDPYLDQPQVNIRRKAGELYDPTGVKTFMAVACHMRYGGSTPIPSSGKPDMTADYPWDARFTAKAVVNWIREGFSMKELP